MSGRSFYSRLNAFIRRILLVGVLLAVGLAAAWLAMQNRVGDEIRREIEHRVAAHYPGYRVTVHDARLVEGKGIEVYDLSIVKRPDIEPLIHIDEIFVAGPVCFQDLVRGAQPECTRVSIRGARVNAHQQADGKWDVARLWPPPKFSEHSPPMMIRDSSVKLTFGQGQVAREVQIRDVQLDVASETIPTPAGTPFNPNAPTRMRVRGLASCDHFRQIKIEGVAPRGGGSWAVKGECLELRLSPGLYDTVPEEFAHYTDQLAVLTGRANIDFRAAGDMRTNAIPAFSGTGTLSNGEIVDKRLPFRLHEVASDFQFDNNGVVIKQLTARNRFTDLTLSLNRQGYATDSPLAIEAKIRRLNLDGRFVEVLPKSLQAEWRKFFPQGQIDANVKLAFDGRQWHPDLQVRCDDVSFAYYKFPYRLEHAHGEVTLKDNLVSVQVTAMAGGQNVGIRGVFRDPGEQMTGWAEFDCKNPIPLDSKLLDSVIDPKAKRVVTSLHPRGMMAAVGRFERQKPDGDVSKFVRIDLHNCTMNYDKFPYPLGMIRGTILWDDSGWSYQNLTGQNDSGFITCNGSWQMAEEADSQLLLKFVGTDIQLDNELRDALNPATRAVWLDLQPRGSIDHLDITLAYGTKQQKLNLDIRAQKWNRQESSEGRSISVHPAWFPYRLDDVSGVAVYRDGVIDLQGLSARHDDAKFSLDGNCRFGHGGPWAVELTKVVGDRMRFDEQLLSALPASLGQAIGKLSLHGDLSMQGAMTFRQAPSRRQPTQAGWNLSIDVEDGSIDNGLQLEHIHGDVRLYGNSTGGGFHSRGELNVDSLVYKGLQLTQVRGPMLIEPGRLVLGSEAERGRTDAAPRSVVANAVDGQLSADAVIYFEGDVPFRLRAGLEGGDLQQFAKEMNLKHQTIQGKANVLINLGGTTAGRHTWRGGGFVRLYDANIYELPFMLDLLKLLSIRQPDRTAFTSGDIDYRIEGEHVYFDRLNFNGNAISLKGRGDMNLDRQINLQFYTLVGSGGWNSNAIRNLLHQASQQLLLIHATGTLDQPHLTRQALPIVKETLDQLFPEVASRQQNAQ